MALDTSNWTRDDLIREAKLQTDAIQRLNVWLRIGYSLLAVGFILGYWGFYGGGGAAFGALGVVLDDEANDGTRGVEKCLSAQESKVAVWLIPTNEELMIARDAYQFVTEKA